MSIPKTNASRILDSLGIPHTLHSARVDERDLSAVTLARLLGVPEEEVYKTLVARGDKGGVLMACIPAAAELDLKRLAAASGNKNVHMMPLKEVQPLTGYLRGGCSPIGTRKAYPVYVDENALLLEQIYVSAGLRGVQLRLTPDDLARAVNAVFAPIARMPDAR